MIRIFAAIAFFALTLSQATFAHQKLEAQKMSEVEALLATIAEPEARVLLVFDIDNTLLKMPKPLGSDAWFTWQENLLKVDPQSQDLVATDFPGLLRVQGWLFALGQMVAPESTTPNLVGQMQAKGYPVILLTSRGAELENVTERELLRNSYSTSKTALSPRAGFAAAYLPYSLENPEKSCLSKEDVQRLGLGESRPVTYRKGVLFSSGQHKGAMLRTLLCKLREKFDHIIFVDDHLKHVTRVYDAYVNEPGEVLSVHYTQMAPEVEAFNKSDKAPLREQWLRLRELIGELF